MSGDTIHAGTVLICDDGTPHRSQGPSGPRSTLNALPTISRYSRAITCLQCGDEGSGFGGVAVCIGWFPHAVDTPTRHPRPESCSAIMPHRRSEIAPRLSHEREQTTDRCGVAEVGPCGSGVRRSYAPMDANRVDFPGAIPCVGAVSSQHPRQPSPVLTRDRAPPEVDELCFSHVDSLLARFSNAASRAGVKRAWRAFLARA